MSQETEKQSLHLLQWSLYPTLVMQMLPLHVIICTSSGIKPSSQMNDCDLERVVTAREVQ